MACLGGGYMGMHMIIDVAEKMLKGFDRGALMY